MKRTRMKPRSKKMARTYSKPGGRREFVGYMLKRFPGCQANTEVCSRRSTQVHELLNRSQGSPLVPPPGMAWDSDEVATLFMAVCFECHHKITFNPAWALENGFRKRRYGVSK